MDSHGFEGLGDIAFTQPVGKNSGCVRLPLQHENWVERVLLFSHRHSADGHGF